MSASNSLLIPARASIFTPALVDRLLRFKTEHTPPLLAYEQIFLADFPRLLQDELVALQQYQDAHPEGRFISNTGWIARKRRLWRLKWLLYDFYYPQAAEMGPAAFTTYSLIKEFKVSEAKDWLLPAKRATGLALPSNQANSCFCDSILMGMVLGNVSYLMATMYRLYWIAKEDLEEEDKKLIAGVWFREDSDTYLQTLMPYPEKPTPQERESQNRIVAAFFLLWHAVVNPHSVIPSIFHLTSLEMKEYLDLLTTSVLTSEPIDPEKEKKFVRTSSSAAKLDFYPKNLVEYIRSYTGELIAKGRHRSWMRNQQDAEEFYRAVATALGLAPFDRLCLGVDYTVSLIGASGEEERIQWSELLLGDASVLIPPDTPPKLGEYFTISQMLGFAIPDEFSLATLGKNDRLPPLYKIDEYVKQWMEKRSTEMKKEFGLTLNSTKRIIGNPRQLFFLIQRAGAGGRKNRARVDLTGELSFLALGGQKRRTYRTRAAVIHDGPSADGGHYTLHLRIGKDFYVYDDTNTLIKQEDWRAPDAFSDHFTAAEDDDDNKRIACFWMEQVDE